MNINPSSASGGTRLILMRHAKSDWGNESLSDHDRPLNPRGRRDAPQIANWIHENGHVPDLILCSSALRTRQTADLLLEQWSSKPAVFVTKHLYLASATQIFTVVREDAILPADESEKIPRTVLVLAHNPGVSEAVGWLTGQMVAMPTAALAVFQRPEENWGLAFEPSQVASVTAMKPKALTWRED